jgi:hypothetical protein
VAVRLPPTSMGRIATFGEVRPPAEQKRSACGGLCNSCNYYKLRGARSNGPFAPDNGVVRLRQHGTVFSFAQKIHNVNFLCKRSRIFRPAGACPERRRMGRYPSQNTESPDTYQQWPFRGFRSCRGVRGPNAHRVTRVINETVIVPRLLFINRSTLRTKLGLHAHLVISYGGSRT